MALETTAPQLGRIDPSSLVGQAAPVVEPRATAALAEAFRSGQIGINDIMDRVSEHTKTKQKADIVMNERAIAEAQDPALIEARRQQMLAAGAQGELVGAQAGAALPNVAEAEVLRMQTAQNAAQIQRYPMAAVFDKLGPKYGVTEPRNPDGSINFAEKSKLGAELIGHEARIENAKSEWNSISKITSADGRQIIEGITPQGKKLSPTEMKAKEDATKESFFKTAPPGTVVAPVVTDTTPAVTADLRSAGEGDTPIVVEPRVTTPAAAAPLPTVGIPGATPPAGTKTEQGFSLGELKDTGVGDGLIKMTGEQASALSRGTFTNEIFKDLKDSYSTLQKESPNLTGPVLGRLATLIFAQDWDPALAGFENAKAAILAPLVKGIFQETGVLSNSDIERYRGTMPASTQTPQVARDNIDQLEKYIHGSIVKNVESFIQQGQVLKPGAMDLYKNSLAELSRMAAGQPASSTPGTPAATSTAAAPAPVVALDSGKKLQRNAQGEIVLIP